MAQELIGMTFANANALIKGLVDLELLRETTGQRRNRRFIYESYLSLFLDDEPDDRAADQHAMDRA